MQACGRCNAFGVSRKMRKEEREKAIETPVETERREHDAAWAMSWAMIIIMGQCVFVQS